MNRRAALLVLPSLVLIATCGGVSGPAATHPQTAAEARQAVLDSVQKSSSTSFLADMTISESFTATGTSASKNFSGLSGQSLSIAVQLSAENLQRIRLTIHGGASGASQFNVVVVTYDGAAYVSTDGGATFKLTPTTGAIAGQYSSDNALAYLQAVGAVTDEGATTVDGVAVERYSAQLDGAKLLALVRSGLSSVPTPTVQALLNAISFKSGGLDVTIDHQGRIVTEHGPMDVSADLGAFGAALAGTTLDIHEVIDAHFHDYGSAVTVTKPAVIASS